MSDQDKTISQVEAGLPELSGVAFDQARQAALDAGITVMESGNGMIYQVAPSGVMTPVKSITPPTRVQKGARIALR